MTEKIISQIRQFEEKYNGIEEALVDVADVRKIQCGFLCSLTVYEDDFSSKTIYKNVLYPRELFKLT